ncbi:histidine triad nucleotide-binding protein [Spirochaetia bacterium]|nr:histidine triad nucleotide-binding protein [Spirochaetia bacterium]
MGDCIFCKISEGKISAKKIFEDDELLAFEDAAPQAPVHFLVIPKKHIANIMECSDAGLLGRLMFKAKDLAVLKGCGEDGARFVVNCKGNGGQTVPHLHVHVLGGRPLAWPPG